MTERNLGFKIEFIGRKFHGWQYQANAPSVQAEMERAWTGLTAERVRFRASSRTDAGVSARGLVCQCFSSSRIPVERLPLALKYHLVPGLVVSQAVILPPAFSLRHQSVAKHYCYRIFNRRIASAFMTDTTYHYGKILRLERLPALVEPLLGEHDFAAFMDQGSPTPTTVRRLDLIRGLRRDDVIELHVLGSGFLYHMVRILAGTALLVMAGDLSTEEVHEAFAKRDRTALGPTLPAQGLCLERVYFDKPLFGRDGRSDYEQLLTQLKRGYYGLSDDESSDKFESAF